MHHLQHNYHHHHHQMNAAAANYRARNNNNSNNSNSNNIGIGLGIGIGNGNGKHEHIREFMDLIDQRNKDACAYLRINNFDVTHQNGQRISVNRAPWYTTKIDDEYNEIFIGKLPRDLFENELLPHLLDVGGYIVKIRYMMDFSGANRGFCFVKFATIADAHRACSVLDGRKLRPDCPPIGVKISFDNKSLFFGNLPPNCSKNQLIRALKKIHIDGIVGGFISTSSRGRTVPSYGPPTPFCGAQMVNPAVALYPRCGTIDFKTHEAATKARRMLLPGEVKILGNKITVDWARSDIPRELRNPICASILGTQSCASQSNFGGHSLMSLDMISNH